MHIFIKDIYGQTLGFVEVEVDNSIREVRAIVRQKFPEAMNEKDHLILKGGGDGSLHPLGILDDERILGSYKYVHKDMTLWIGRYIEPAKSSETQPIIEKHLVPTIHIPSLVIIGLLCSGLGIGIGMVI